MEDVINDWSFTASLEFHSVGSPEVGDIHFYASMDTSAGADALTWSGQLVGHRRVDSSCFTLTGSGQGDGDVLDSTDDPDVDPSTWGLDPAEYPVSVLPRYFDDYLGTETETDCATHAEVGHVDARYTAVGGRVLPFFLPGTPDELEAMPAGTVISRQYGYTAADENFPSYTNTFQVSYSATKRSPDDSPQDPPGGDPADPPTVPGTFGHIGSLCGTARTTLYNAGEEEVAKKGQHLCTFAVSNAVARHLLSMTYGSDELSLSDSFVRFMHFGARAAHAKDTSVREGAQQAFDAMWDKTYDGPSPTDPKKFGSYWAARKIFGPAFEAAEATAERANPLFFIGTLASAPALGLPTLLRIHQILAKDACVQFVLTRSGSDHVDVDSALLYNPDHFTDPQGSHARMFTKKARRGRLDEFRVKHLAMTCTSSGAIAAGPKRDTSDVFEAGWKVTLGRGPRP